MPNDSDSHDRSGAEEFVAAEIELATALDPEQEKALRQSLAHLDAEAIDSCDIHAGKISISYDPTRTKKRDLLQLIEAAGGKTKHVESESSPLVGKDE